MSETPRAVTELGKFHLANVLVTPPPVGISRDGTCLLSPDGASKPGICQLSVNTNNTEVIEIIVPWEGKYSVKVPISRIRIKPHDETTAGYQIKAKVTLCGVRVFLDPHNIYSHHPSPGDLIWIDKSPAAAFLEEFENAKDLCDLVLFDAHIGELLAVETMDSIASRLEKYIKRFGDAQHSSANSYVEIELSEFKELLERTKEWQKHHSPQA